jgi:hypothetical protein
MNKQRRQQIVKIAETISELSSELETLRDEEQEYLENMPESLVKRRKESKDDRQELQINGSSVLPEWLDTILDARLTPTGWEFKIHDHTPNQEYKIVYEGNLQEIIELILLGKLHKAQLQAMDKKEPITFEKAMRKEFESCSGNLETQDDSIVFTRTFEHELCPKGHEMYVAKWGKDWIFACPQCLVVDKKESVVMPEGKIRELQNNG